MARTESEPALLAVGVVVLLAHLLSVDEEPRHRRGHLPNKETQNSV